MARLYDLDGNPLFDIDGNPLYDSYGWEPGDPPENPGAGGSAPIRRRRRFVYIDEDFSDVRGKDPEKMNMREFEKWRRMRG